MAQSSILPGDLKASHCTNATEVCLLRFREARNVKKGRELIGVDMLRLDENLTLIQWSVSANRLSPFLDVQCRIILNVQQFRRHKEQQQLYHRVISIFDALALAFYNKLESYGTEPTIVLATSINPKIVGGQLTGEGTYETTSSSKVVYAQKVALIVSELKQYVIAADPQEDEEVPDAQLPGVNALASNGAADENSNVAPHHPCLLIQLPKVNHQPNSNLIRARVDPRMYAWHKFT
uniref:Uncharacterized protein n=1 Tax=Brassica campestris TaxID=3711 RepID=M4D181_BRACM